MTLTEFLLARIAEDEAVARDAHYEGQHWYSEEEMVDRWPEICDCGCPVMFAANRKIEAEHIARHDPARVLAECEAKRRIVDLHDGQGIASCASCYYDDYESGLLPADWPCSTIKALALPYADHPDYRAEWKP